MKKNSKVLLLTLISALSLCGCNKKQTSEIKSEAKSETTSQEQITSIEETSSLVEEASSSIEEISSTEQYPEVDLSYRAARNFESYGIPSNETNEEQLPLISNRNYKVVDINSNKAMVSKDVRLEFVNDQDKYYPQLVSLKTLSETAQASNAEIMFSSKKTVVIYLKGSN